MSFTVLLQRGGLILYKYKDQNITSKSADKEIHQLQKGS